MSISSETSLFVSDSNDEPAEGLFRDPQTAKQKFLEHFQRIASWLEQHDIESPLEMGMFLRSFEDVVCRLPVIEGDSQNGQWMPLNNFHRGMEGDGRDEAFELHVGYDEELVRYHEFQCLRLEHSRSALKSLYGYDWDYPFGVVSYDEDVI